MAVRGFLRVLTCVAFFDHTVLCKSNESEYRRISANFGDISMKSQRNHCSDIIAISCRYAKFRMAFRSKFRLGKQNFGQHFVSGSEISCDISFGGAKFRATFHLAGRNSSLRF